MNHDYAHCADFTDGCPKKCFRAQLVRDLQKYGKLAPYGINFPISWAHFKGTDECKRKEVATPPECEGDCGWCKPSVIEKCKGVTE